MVVKGRQRHLLRFWTNLVPLEAVHEIERVSRGKLTIPNECMYISIYVTAIDDEVMCYAEFYIRCLGENCAFLNTIHNLLHAGASRSLEQCEETFCGDETKRSSPASR